MTQAMITGNRQKMIPKNPFDMGSMGKRGGIVPPLFAVLLPNSFFAYTPYTPDIFLLFSHEYEGAFPP